MALTHLTHLARVLLPFVASSVCVVWLTFSGTCTRLHPGSRGPNGMVPLPSRHSFCGSLPQSVLSWLQSLLFSFSFMCPALLVRHVRFSFSSDELCITPRVFVYLLNLCKFYIWQSRNDFRFRNIPPGAVDVIAKVKARLKCHLPIFFKHFQSSRCRGYFHRQWGAHGVVASVSGNALSIVL